MPLIDPLYVPVVAALSGVSITILGQALVSLAQRRHDRVTKLFDTKAELFSAVMAALDQLVDVKQVHATALSEFRRNEPGYKEAIAEKQHTAAAILAFQAEHLIDNTLQPADQAVELAQVAKALIDSYQSASTEVDTAKSELEVLAASLNEAKNNLFAASNSVRELIAKMSLIAEDRVMHELALVFHRAARELPFERKHLEGFRRAARIELGAGVSRIRGRLNDGERKVRYWLVEQQEVRALRRKRT